MQRNQGNKIKIFFYIGLFLIIFCFIFPKTTYASTYYLDAVNGNDSNYGSVSEPWQTLDKAQETTISGDIVYLKTGDYGAYTETNHSARTDYITYQALENETVHFDRIGISNDSITDTYLKFVGINIKPDWVDPCSGGQIGCDDPQYPESTQSTYTKTAHVVSITNARAVKIINSKLEGQLKYLTNYGVTISGGEDITVDRCEITRVQRGVNMMTESSNIKILNNHIHDIGASAIVQGNSTCSDILIEGNHAHDSRWSALDDYSPRAPNQNYHGSGIALRNGNVTVRNNIIHDGFPSAGMMCYDGGNFDNVIFENNLLYDISNVYVLRIYGLGDNMVIRNNTLIGSIRSPRPDAPYEYNTTLAVHSLATDGMPNLTLNNNILIGASYLGPIANSLSRHNNIYYSVSAGSGWECSPENSIAMACINWQYPDRSEITSLFSCGDYCDLSRGNGLEMDYSLAQHSQAINFGNPELQPADSLGSIGADGFIIADGLSRSTAKHSAGAYEYSYKNRADVDGSLEITTTDALLTLRNSLGLSMNGTAWQASSITGDVNCDGNANSTDALLILRHSLGLSMSGTGWCE